MGVDVKPAFGRGEIFRQEADQHVPERAAKSAAKARIESSVLAG
jgi:hypothetical protein